MSDQHKHSGDQAVKEKARSVTKYLAILFAVAFLLLLLAYFMQRRNNETMIGTLRDSMNSMETLNDLIDENRALREDTDTLENRLEDALADVEEAQHQTQEAQAQAEKAAAAQEGALADRDALLLLEKLEYLVSIHQLEEAAQLWDGQLETLLPALDDPELRAEGQLSLEERVKALKLALFPDYAP